MNYAVMEREIINCTKNNNFEVIINIEGKIKSKLVELDYVMTRFLDEYGDKVDSNENCGKFNKVKSEEYSQLERLLRVIKAYKK
jgi:hypothetical protein